MPAANMETLLDFETQIEAAAVSILEAATGLGCFGTLGMDALTMPRLEVQSRLNEAVDPPTQRDGGASPATIDYTAYYSALQVRVITDNTQGQSANHALIRGKIRAAFLQSASNFDGITLPFLAMKYFRPTGTQSEADQDFNISTLDYELRFTIRADAWPI